MQPAFLLRTTLTPDEQRASSTQFDNDVIDLLTSEEAEKACSKMWLIYTRLRRADAKFWQRPNILYLATEIEGTAWQQLCMLSGTSSATLNKAIKWMAEKNVIRYRGYKNGSGIVIHFKAEEVSQ